MLPIANMIAKANIEDGLTKVVGVEEEPEGVNDAGALVDDDENSRSV